MVKSVAGFIAAPMWHEAMAYALSKYPKTYFGEPSPILTSVPPMLQGKLVCAGRERKHRSPQLVVLDR